MTHPMLEVANADFVTDVLAVGGDLAYDEHLAAAQIVDLLDSGITHILDVRQECDDADLWAHLPMTYRWAGIDDAGQHVPASWFESVTAWAEQAIADGGVVLTHCHMGINRGPSAGFAVLLRLGWNPVEALEAIRAARPIAAIAYWDDALAWHLDRVGASPQQRAEAVRRCDAWHRANHIDVVRIIRTIRLQEAS